MGQPLGAKTQFTVLQSYDYQSNDAYATGAQSIEAAIGMTHALSSRNDVWFMGWGGLTVLGAIDSLPLGITERPEKPEPGPGGGQGVSEGPRFYDYGPGATFGASALFSRDRRPFAAVLYEGRHLYSLDGVRANHFLQRTRLDLLLPLRGAWASACPESTSSVRASTRTRNTRSWSIAIPSSVRISRGASSEPTASTRTPLRHAGRLARRRRGRSRSRRPRATGDGAGSKPGRRTCG